MRAGRGAVPIHRERGVMSHKFASYINAPTPSYAARRGPSAVRGGAESAEVLRGRPAGAWKDFLCQSIHIRAQFTPGLWLFMPIYFMLSV